MQRASTLLVPLDGSPLSETALRHAEVLARTHAAPIRLLSVVERRPRGLTSRSEAAAVEREATDRARLSTYLERTARALGERGISVSTELTEGPVADRVLAATTAPDVELVVMTTHGRAGVDRVDRWSLDNVSDLVARTGTKPVVLVPVPYTASLAPRTSRLVALERLMVPVDGSQLAESAVAAAAELARTAGARLYVIRVEPWLTEGAAAEAMNAEFAAREQEAAEAAAAYVREVCDRLPSGIDVEPVVLRGRASESLTGFAHHERIDLVVMTTHGRGGLRRFILGSTAQHLIGAGIPAWIHRPLEADTEAAASGGAASPA